MSTTERDRLAARLAELERQNGRRKRNGAVILVLLGAGLLIAAQGERRTRAPLMPGWVVVEKSITGDDTPVIQAAIDSLPQDGGVVFFPAGIYKHTGLRGIANLHLKGVHTPSVILDYTPEHGDGITFHEDPDHFAISDLTLTSSGRTKGWALRVDKGAHRALRLHRVNITGFLNGAYIANALNCTLDQCYIGGTYPKAPQGIDIQLGDGKEFGGNGVTIADVYFSCLAKGVVTYASSCLVERPILELCKVGVEAHGTTTVIHPWVDATTESHFSIQPNTLGGVPSGTGALLLGYGSAGGKLQYGGAAEQQRTVIIPERLDFGPGSDPNDPRGIKLGSVVIDNQGVIHGGPNHARKLTAQ